MTLMPMPGGSCNTAGIAANAPRPSGSMMTVRNGMSTRFSAMRRNTPSIASIHAAIGRSRFTDAWSISSISGTFASLVLLEEVDNARRQQQVVCDAGDLFCFPPHGLELCQLALQRSALLRFVRRHLECQPNLGRRLAEVRLQILFAPARFDNRALSDRRKQPVYGECALDFLHSALHLVAIRA